MNFAKMMVIVAIAVAVIGSIVFFTRTDRSNPAEVAAAFTKAMKKQDTATASGFYLPDKAEAWKTAIDTKIDAMKSGSFADYFERIPAEPVFTSPVGAAGKVTLQSAAKDMSLEMTEVDSKWYVSGTTL
ncbi:MAG: hypothetical protein WBD40_05585 [Tepidisphaeraceae bacterium]